MSFKPEKYKVWHVQYKLSLIDPDMPQPRYHHVIFVETDKDGGGYIHHVTGDITSGMSYQRKRAQHPGNSDSFHTMDFLGYIASSGYPGAVDDVLKSLTSPGRQKAFNPKTYKTEPIKDDGTFYSPGEPRKRLKKCTEWTLEQAIPALKANKLLQ